MCAIALALSAGAAEAQSDVPLNVTAFIGVAMTPDAHGSAGFAVGLKPSERPVSLEFEYGRSGSEPDNGVPGMLTYSGNVVVQPRQPRRTQIYGTAGIGFYRMILNGHSNEANDARNIGGGVKRPLAGGLMLRLDYRVFVLGAIQGEYHSNEHRFYAGVVAGF